MKFGNLLFSKLLLIALLLLFSLITRANISIFNNQRDKAPDKAETKSAPVLNKHRSQQWVSLDEMELQGLSQFDNKVILHIKKKPVAKTKKIVWDRKQSSELKINKKYKVIDIKGRTLIIQTNKEVICNPNKLRGRNIICIDKHKFKYTLSRKIIKSPSKPVKAVKKTNNNNKINPIKKTNNKKNVNPFASLLKMKKQRIKETTLPENMRVIHTPFGDKVVPK